MICPSCSKEILDSSEICPECGAVLSPAFDTEAPAAEPLAEKPAGPIVEPRAEQIAAIALRRASKFTATFTRMEVFIDDLKVGDLMTGERRQFDLQPGLHTLYIRLDSFKSPKVSLDLGAGEILQLVCSPKMLGWGVNLTKDKG